MILKQSKLIYELEMVMVTKAEAEDDDGNDDNIDNEWVLHEKKRKRIRMRIFLQNFLQEERRKGERRKQDCNADLTACTATKHNGNARKLVM